MIVWFGDLGTVIPGCGFIILRLRRYSLYLICDRNETAIWSFVRVDRFCVAMPGTVSLAAVFRSPSIIVFSQGGWSHWWNSFFPGRCYRLLVCFMLDPVPLFSFIVFQCRPLFIRLLFRRLFSGSTGNLGNWECRRPPLETGGCSFENLFAESHYWWLWDEQNSCYSLNRQTLWCRSRWEGF